MERLSRWAGRDDGTGASSDMCAQGDMLRVPLRFAQASAGRRLCVPAVCVCARERECVRVCGGRRRPGSREVPRAPGRRAGDIEHVWRAAGPRLCSRSEGLRRPASKQPAASSQQPVRAWPFLFAWPGAAVGWHRSVGRRQDQCPSRLRVYMYGVHRHAGRDQSTRWEPYLRCWLQDTIASGRARCDATGPAEIPLRCSCMYIRKSTGYYGVLHRSRGRCGGSGAPLSAALRPLFPANVGCPDAIATSTWRVTCSPDASSASGLARHGQGCQGCQGFYSDPTSPRTSQPGAGSCALSIAQRRAQGSVRSTGSSSTAQRLGSAWQRSAGCYLRVKGRTGSPVPSIRVSRWLCGLSDAFQNSKP